MNTETTFNVVEGQLVRYFCDRPENAWDGFELVDTGGGCEAYQYAFTDGRYVWLTTTHGDDVEGLSDDNFIVGVYSSDGCQIASVERFCEVSDGQITTKYTVQNDVDDPVFPTSFSPLTIDEVLTVLGIEDQHE